MKYQGTREIFFELENNYSVTLSLGLSIGVSKVDIEVVEIEYHDDSIYSSFELKNRPEETQKAISKQVDDLLIDYLADHTHEILIALSE